MKNGWSIICLIVLFYACKHQTVRLEGYEIHGIDVSHYQSKIDWRRIAQQDIHFAFVKATEGVSIVDSLFCENWQAITDAGLKRGAYHFFHPTVSGEEQAQQFIDLVEMEYGDLPPVLDVEVLGNVSKVQLITEMRDWIFLVEIHYNIKPIIYTNLKFYNKYLAGHFEDYPLWIARYNTRKPRLASGRNWQFWQYGNQGRIDGIYGNVDFNVFSGTHNDLEDMCLAPKPILSSN